MEHCHICYSTKDIIEVVCDRCEEAYCYECSYTYSIHYQYEGNLCYLCADQSRRNRLTKEMKRSLKIEYVLKKD